MKWLDRKIDRGAVAFESWLHHKFDTIKHANPASIPLFLQRIQRWLVLAFYGNAIYISLSVLVQWPVHMPQIVITAFIGILIILVKHEVKGMTKLLKSLNK